MKILNLNLNLNYLSMCYQSHHYLFSNTVSVLKNRNRSADIVLSSNSFFFGDVKVDYGVGSQPYGISLGDIDLDGDLDISVLNLCSITVSVLRNNGDGTYAAKVDYGVGSEQMTS